MFLFECLHKTDWGFIYLGHMTESQEVEIFLGQF
jgi:hypothetical protein